MIDVESYTKGNPNSYTPNVYCVANFYPENWGADGVQTVQSNENGKYYFFMTPKVQEVCKITFAEWNGTTFTVPTSSGFYKNTLTLDWDYNENNSNPTDGDAVTPNLGKNKLYKFHAIVQRSVSKGTKGALTDTDGSIIYPTDLTGADNIVTAINTVEIGNGQVKSVKYVNVAGIVSDTPFQGVNIVVTEYTDGSRTTAKMLRK